MDRPALVLWAPVPPDGDGGRYQENEKEKDSCHGDLRPWALASIIGGAWRSRKHSEARPIGIQA